MEGGSQAQDHGQAIYAKIRYNVSSTFATGCSLTKHIDGLRILLANYPLDVISINETRLDEGILNSEIRDFTTRQK